MAWRLILAAAAPLLISACADSYQAAREAQPQGPAFNQALYDDYLDLASEARGEDDWANIEYFAGKAMSAAAGEAVAPDELDRRDLPLASEPDLIAARRRLIGLLNRGAAESSPIEAADAQVSFDCWMQEQEDNRHAEEIGACRTRFDDAMARLDAVLTEPAATAASAPAPALLPGPFVVYFDFDSDVLSDEGRRTVRRAVKSASAASASGFVLSAPRDPADTSDHDVAHLCRRVQSVADALSSSGVFGDRIRITGHGDARPDSAARDPQREANSRRVEIALVR